ncbi:hypothetical protein TPENAI_61164 [Tenacibaculum litopenaei]|uniref:hypothetical protein n=1 Tax=Tenacibaculum litopenaei TaxID=396016 RepID=UPI003893956B
MKFILLFSLFVLLPSKEYVVIDIRDLQLSYVILLKEIKTQELFCMETLKTKPKYRGKVIAINDTISLKLRKIKKVVGFKTSKNIKSFDDLSIYDDSLKVNKKYYCKELKGLHLKSFNDMGKYDCKQLN